MRHKTNQHIFYKPSQYKELEGSTLNQQKILMMGFNHPTKKKPIKTLILTFKFENLIIEESLMKKGLQQKSPKK